MVDEQEYERFAWVIDGVTAMFEGTRDPSYLVTALNWVELMKGTARIVDLQGYMNWAGSWASPYSPTPIFQHQYDLEIGRAMARVARLILTDAVLAPTYGARAQAIYTFVQKHIADKWLRARGGSCAWVLTSTYNFGDKASFWGHMLADLVAVVPNSAYRTEIGYVVQGLISRLRPYGTSGALYIVDNGYGDNADTSHANHAVHFAVRAYLDGLGVTMPQVQGLAKLLTTVIWNQSITDPMFTNYTDGSNGYYGPRGPYASGQVYQGWVQLALVDEDVKRVMAAVLDAIIAGLRNPSLDYNSTIYGKTELAGHLTAAGL